MKDNQFGELCVIGMKGCEAFTDQVDYYLRDWRRHGDNVTGGKTSFAQKVIWRLKIISSLARIK